METAYLLPLLLGGVPGLEHGLGPVPDAAYGAQVYGFVLLLQGLVTVRDRLRRGVTADLRPQCRILTHYFLHL